MKLIDTSAWIHALRPNGDVAVRSAVANLLQSGEAAWCPMIRLELWNGARGDHEKRVLQEMEEALPDLEITSAVWKLAITMGCNLRSRGQTVPSTDLIIAACARHYQVALVHADAHFETISGLT